MGFTPDDYDAAADFAETGEVTCDSCGSRVRTRSLESLPPHRCAEQRGHNEQIRLLDAGQPAGCKTTWVPERFRTKSKED